MTVGGFSFVTSLVAWYAIKRAMGVRVKAEDEVSGLDIAEMGMEAYPDAVEIEAKVEKETGLRASVAGRHRDADSGGEVAGQTIRLHPRGGRTSVSEVRPPRLFPIA